MLTMTQQTGTATPINQLEHRRPAINQFEHLRPAMATTVMSTMTQQTKTA
jgi:hypothetical protein